jgi:hypothetical protein
MNRQVEIKAEQIARMIVKGMQGSRVAIEMGMSYDGLQRILRQPEYLEIEERIRKGVLDKMDARLEKRAEMSDIVEDAVPEAMQILIDNVKKKRDLRSALELLDRDPKRQFAKSKQINNDPLSAGPQIATETLSAAIKEADITHSILERHQQNPLSKPAEA